ncbi:chemotaxis response regulator protein-glutamate methylesterase [Alteromonas gracilis]|uniref:protein-glutamate methylesterase/protein-glutamine glutaminase n=1 Tax=Alteromonas gracilis TaxID=1479524 RepID=UPI0037367FCB
MTNAQPIKLMLIDDSALVRQAFTSLFEKVDDIKVVAVAPDPFIAVEKLKKTVPDVILLDVEMPKMDGVTFLKKLMAQHPIPVIICSTLVGQQSATHMAALEAGAVDIIPKPSVGIKQFAQDAATILYDAVRAASNAKIKLIKKQAKHVQKLKADAVIARKPTSAMHETTDKIICIGASTGGTEAIKAVLMKMPRDCPAIAIVQHMPEGFTASFAKRLNDQCAISVSEGTHGMSLLRGHAIIAPGNHHMTIRRSGAKYFVEIKDGPLVSRHRPSVDVLFRSAANTAASNSAAAILTGMGDDGAQGLLELRESGAVTFAQDEATSVVWGMPRMAIQKGGAEKVIALENVAQYLLKASGYASK